MCSLGFLSDYECGVICIIDQVKLIQFVWIHCSFLCRATIKLKLQKAGGAEVILCISFMFDGEIVMFYCLIYIIKFACVVEYNQYALFCIVITGI